MRVVLFFKLMLISLCVSLLSFGFLPEATIMGTLKMMAVGTVLSIGITVFYPDIRGVRAGDRVAVVANIAIPGMLGRLGRAAAHGKINDHIKITLQNGSEVLGVIESYPGLVSPAKIRILYEERLVG